MTEFLITTCSKEKNDTPGCLPAIDRYQHKRITFVYHESQRLGFPMLILSGEFGILRPGDLIPWYDHALKMSEVPELVSCVVGQLHLLRVTRLQFYARPPDEPGWSPYHDVLNQACCELKIKLSCLEWSV